MQLEILVNLALQGLWYVSFRPGTYCFSEHFWVALAMDESESYLGRSVNPSCENRDKSRGSPACPLTIFETDGTARGRRVYGVPLALEFT